MTIAELHGKLSPHRQQGLHDRMEDLLTSDVFGAMKYAGWRYGFIQWLRSAENPYDQHPAAKDVLPVSKNIKDIHFEFWPTLRGGNEPDLMLCIETTDDRVTLVMIEVKYLSGPSDGSPPEEWVPGEDSGDQLAKQINGFPDRVAGCNVADVADRVHIYLTRHDQCPRHCYDKAEQYLDRPDRVKMFWLIWYTLHRFLVAELGEAQCGVRALLGDLSDLLKKKRLLPFNGFKGRRLLLLSSRGGFFQKDFWAVGLPQPLVGDGGFMRKSTKGLNDG
jgi:hypothetical protein